MKVYFDSNVIIDILAQSDWVAQSLAAYDAATLHHWSVFVSASAVSDIVYVLHRRGLSCEQAAEKVPLLLELFNVIDVSRADCEVAAASSMTDFEDALIAAAASRHGMDLIVTRDQKGFTGSSVKTMSPAEFVESFKPANVEYEAAELPKVI